VKLRDKFDGANDVLVEHGEIICRDPVLQDGLAADLVNFVAVDE
jgi:hypothetical protein